MNRFFSLKLTFSHIFLPHWEKIFPRTRILNQKKVFFLKLWLKGVLTWFQTLIENSNLRNRQKFSIYRSYRRDIEDWFHISYVSILIIIESDRLMATRIIAIPVDSNSFSKHESVHELLMYKSSDNSNLFDSNTHLLATLFQCIHSITNTPLIAI
jgi:hypothetical protein